jgi:hypothetical protein
MICLPCKTLEEAIYYLDNNQEMQTAAGKQKGIQSILTERGLWRDTMLI